jgi:hypothetical protein
MTTQRLTSAFPSLIPFFFHKNVLIAIELRGEQLDQDSLGVDCCGLFSFLVRGQMLPPLSVYGGNKEE